jgi:hypothetical protein
MCLPADRWYRHSDCRSDRGHGREKYVCVVPVYVWSSSGTGEPIGPRAAQAVFHLHVKRADTTLIGGQQRDQDIGLRDIRRAAR